MNRTKIQWTDYSWPVINGCRRKSEGCRGCYAERLSATRLSKTAKYGGLAVFTKGGPRWSGEARLWEPELVGPLKLRSPSRIFVADMGDLFYEGVAEKDIVTIFAVMALAGTYDGARGHTFQVLTKRIDRARYLLTSEHFRAAVATAVLEVAERYPGLHATKGTWPQLVHDGIINDEARAWPLSGLWLGTSVEDQQTADERIPELLRCPADRRWISAEPLLGPVDLTKYLDVGSICECDSRSKRDERCEGKGRRGWIRCNAGGRTLEWVVVGGESGPTARPFDLHWAREIVAQCAAVKGWGTKPKPVPCFVKQLGARAVDAGCAVHTKDRHGGEPSEWEPDLRVRQFPEARP